MAVKGYCIVVKGYCVAVKGYCVAVKGCAGRQRPPASKWQACA